MYWNILVQVREHWWAVVSTVKKNVGNFFNICGTVMTVLIVLRLWAQCPFKIMLWSLDDWAWFKWLTGPCCFAFSPNMFCCWVKTYDLKEVCLGYFVKPLLIEMSNLTILRCVWEAVCKKQLVTLGGTQLVSCTEHSPSRSSHEKFCGSAAPLQP